MSQANYPPPLPQAISVEPLSYQTAAEIPALRWVVRMLGMLMIGHVLGALGQVVQALLLGASYFPWWRSALALPTVIVFGVAAILLMLRARGALTAVIGAYCWNLLALMIPWAMQVATVARASSGGSMNGRMQMASSVWGLFSLGAGTIEAVVIIAIVARCRNAGATD